MVRSRGILHGGNTRQQRNYFLENLSRLKKYRKGKIHLSMVKKVVLLLMLLPPVVILFWLFSYSYSYHKEQEPEIKIIQLDTERDIAKETQGKWIVEGWDYHKELVTVSKDYEVDAEHLFFRTEDNMDESSWPTGFWILGRARNKSKNVDNANSFKPFIRLKDFQREVPEEVSIGISLYVEGNAKIKVRFWHGPLLVESKTITIKTEEMYFHYGFCNEILKVPFRGIVHEIEIEGYVHDPVSYIVLDKIYAAVATNGKSETLIYTMMPKDWCETLEEKSNS